MFYFNANTISTFNTGGSISSVLPKIYYEKFRLKGNRNRLYNIFQSHNDSQLRQAAKVLFGNMSKSEHAKLAKEYDEKYNKANKEYSAYVDYAFKKEFDKKATPSDYKVSGIWSDDFSEATKNELRKLLNEINEYRAAYYLHNAASKYADGGEVNEDLFDVTGYRDGERVVISKKPLTEKEAYELVSDAIKSRLYYDVRLSPTVYAKGGEIQNQYEDMAVSEVWDAWNDEQRQHFLKDHNLTQIHPSKVMEYSFSDLPATIKQAIVFHKVEGQYENGGEIKDKQFIGWDGVPFEFDTRPFAVIASMDLTSEEVREEAKIALENREIDEVDYNRIIWYIENVKEKYAKGGSIIYGNYQKDNPKSVHINNVQIGKQYISPHTDDVVRIKEIDKSGKYSKDAVAITDNNEIIASNYLIEIDGNEYAKGGSISLLQEKMDKHKAECMEMYPNGKMKLVNGLYGVEFNGKLHNTLYIGKRYFEIDGTVYEERENWNQAKATNLKLAKGGEIQKKAESMANVNHALVVVCSSVGNPDFGQNSNAPYSPTRIVPVITLRDAQHTVRNYIDYHDLGGGNWSGGQVYHPTKGLIALISYNGRVWHLPAKGEESNYYGKTEYTDKELDYDYTKFENGGSVNNSIQIGANVTIHNGEYPDSEGYYGIITKNVNHPHYAVDVYNKNKKRILSDVSLKEGELQIIPATHAIVLVISNKQPLYTQLNKLYPDNSFLDIPNEQNPHLLFSPTMNKYIIVFSHSYIMQVDKSVIKDNLDYIKKTYGITRITWADKQAKKQALAAMMYANGGKLDMKEHLCSCGMKFGEGGGIEEFDTIGFSKVMYEYIIKLLKPFGIKQTALNTFEYKGKKYELAAWNKYEDTDKGRIFTGSEIVIHEMPNLKAVGSANFNPDSVVLEFEIDDLEIEFKDKFHMPFEVNENKLMKHPIKIYVNGTREIEMQGEAMYNFRQANAKARKIWKSKKFSDMAYHIEYSDGEIFSGYVDLEPYSFHESHQRRILSNHLTVLWNNIAKIKEPKFSVTQEDIQEAKDVLVKYSFNDMIPKNFVGLIEYDEYQKPNVKINSPDEISHENVVKAVNWLVIIDGFATYDVGLIAAFVAPDDVLKEINDKFRKIKNQTALLRDDNEYPIPPYEGSTFKKGGRASKLTYEIVEIPAFNQYDERKGSWYRIYDNMGRLKTLYTTYWLGTQSKRSITEVSDRKIAEKILNDIVKGKHDENRVLSNQNEYAKGGSIETDTPISPEIIAERVADEVVWYFYSDSMTNWESLSDKEKKELVRNQNKLKINIIKYLVKRAEVTYKNNSIFAKRVVGKGNTGRDYLYFMMQHWCGYYNGIPSLKIETIIKNYNRKKI